MAEASRVRCGGSLVEKAVQGHSSLGVACPSAVRRPAGRVYWQRSRRPVARIRQGPLRQMAGRGEFRVCFGLTAVCLNEGDVPGMAKTNSLSGRMEKPAGEWSR